MQLEDELLLLGQLSDQYAHLFRLVACLYLCHEVVFIGNSQTRVIDGRMVTPRGYTERNR